tara:strand:+ start:608 stop:778 length:171 start_codon:yes stop_codon:yes gene_type:complete
MVHLSEKLRNVTIKISRIELNIIQDLIAQRIGEDKSYNLVDDELYGLKYYLDEIQL